MGRFTAWQNEVDIGLRPRHVFEGTEVNLYPLSKRGLEWLDRNLDKFSEPGWSERDRCLELSELDCLALHLVVQRLLNVGLKVRFYGRLDGWDGESPAWLQLSAELRGEKQARLKGANVVLKPLFIAVVLIVFALCFWWLDVGFVFSIAAAIIAYPAMLFGIALPIGYVLGKRSARRFKARAPAPR